VLTKGEQETIVRWDQGDRVAHLYTAYEPDARRWQRAGIEAQQRGGSWSAEVPA
jgi:Ni/Co efflux regulator RcnB